ncbi:unnamed protein product [Vicia faba]|uniref:Uncharacterized protein n=1 Tax=Vicia faba TaxID=3906 RepID=A0AAV0ZTV1_VICFA|nr:unnamed protein product [Vicia faba]
MEGRRDWISAGERREVAAALARRRSWRSICWVAAEIMEEAHSCSSSSVSTTIFMNLCKTGVRKKGLAAKLMLLLLRFAVEAPSNVRVSDSDSGLGLGSGLEFSDELVSSTVSPIFTSFVKSFPTRNNDFDFPNFLMLNQATSRLNYSTIMMLCKILRTRGNNG